MTHAPVAAETAPAPSSRATERPILMTGPMVRAILDGRKTQTRRIVKPQPTIDPGGRMYWRGMGWTRHHEELVGPHGTMLSRCPHGVPGDRLWVRERWYPAYRRTESNSGVVFPSFSTSRATLGHPNEANPGWSPNSNGKGWKPSIHMPRWASRITLELSAVRLERLQDISEEDAKAEGLSTLSKDDGRTWKFGIPDRDGLPGTDDDGWPWQDWNVDPRLAYRHLWTDIHGSRAWDANPWVWVLTFARVGG